MLRGMAVISAALGFYHSRGDPTIRLQYYTLTMQLSAIWLPTISALGMAFGLDRVSSGQPAAASSSLGFMYPKSKATATACPRLYSPMQGPLQDAQCSMQVCAWKAAQTQL